METSTSSSQGAENSFSQTDSARSTFPEKEFLANFELAKFQATHEAEMEKKASEYRKNVARIVGGILVVVSILLSFIIWCISIGKEQFVIEVLRYILYPVSASFGYWAGKASRNSQDETSPDYGR